MAGWGDLASPAGGAEGKPGWALPWCGGRGRPSYWRRPEVVTGSHGPSSACPEGSIWMTVPLRTKRSKEAKSGRTSEGHFCWS